MSFFNCSFSYLWCLWAHWFTSLWFELYLVFGFLFGFLAFWRTFGALHKLFLLLVHTFCAPTYTLLSLYTFFLCILIVGSSFPFTVFPQYRFFLKFLSHVSILLEFCPRLLLFWYIYLFCLFSVYWWLALTSFLTIQQDLLTLLISVYY